MVYGPVYESSIFTQKIDLLELLHTTIREHEGALENRIADLENLQVNLRYLRALSRHESVTPGNLASHAVHRGSSRGDRRP